MYENNLGNNNYAQMIKNGIQSTINAHQNQEFEATQNPKFLNQSSVYQRPVQQVNFGQPNPYGYGMPYVNPNIMNPNILATKGTWYGQNPFTAPSPQQFVRQQPTNPNYPPIYVRDRSYVPGYGFIDFIDNSFMIPTKEEVDRGDAVQVRLVTSDEYKKIKEEENKKIQEESKNYKSPIAKIEEAIANLSKPGAVKIEKGKDPDFLDYENKLQEKRSKKAYEHLQQKINALPAMDRCGLKIKEDDGTNIYFIEQRARQIKYYTQRLHEMGYDKVKDKIPHLDEIYFGKDMDWQEEDYKKLNALADRIAPFSIALAWLVRHLDTFEFDYELHRRKGLIIQNRVDFMVWTTYLEDYVRDMEAKDEASVVMVYKYLSYRYIPDPIGTYVEDKGIWMYDIEFPPTRKYDVDGNEYIKYPTNFDRGRSELTEEEAELFVAKEVNTITNTLAYYETLVRVQHFYKWMRNHIDNPMPTDQTVETVYDYYNPYDPTSRYFHAMKLQEATQDHQYKLYKYLLRNKYTEEEFDDWWFGKKKEKKFFMMQPNENIDRYQAHRMHVDQMTTLSRMQLDKFVPSSQTAKAQGAAIMNHNAKVCKEFDGGIMDNIDGLRGFFDNLGRYSIKIAEENVERQRQEAFMQRNKPVVPHMLYNNIHAKSPEEIGKNGGIFGMPQGMNRFQSPNVVDIRSDAKYNEKRKEFMNACETMGKVTIPLKPFFR